MPAQQFELPRGFNGEVRLFPLPDFVVFPRNVLPLHIFESRYVEMLEDALQGDRLIAMATLTPGYESDYYSRPAIFPFTCIGRVTDHKRTEQGAYNLLLAGLRRAEIEREIEPVRSFRRAVVRVLEDDVREAAGDAQRIRSEVAERILQALPAAKELAEAFIQGAVSLASFTDVAAFHLPIATDIKLQLLREANVLSRAKLLLSHLQPRKGDDQRSHQSPPGFSLN
jgi:ATP-dependent Lon protease